MRIWCELTANIRHRARGYQARAGVGGDGGLVVALARVVRITAVGGSGALVQTGVCAGGDLRNQAGDVGGGRVRGGGGSGGGQANQGGESDGLELHVGGGSGVWKLKRGWVVE